jgi:hypothetical protein
MHFDPNLEKKVDFNNFKFAPLLIFFFFGMLVILLHYKSLNIICHL